MRVRKPLAVVLASAAAAAAVVTGTGTAAFAAYDYQSCYTGSKGLCYTVAIQPHQTQGWIRVKGDPGSNIALYDYTNTPQSLVTGCQGPADGAWHTCGSLNKSHYYRLAVGNLYVSGYTENYT